MKKIIYTLSLLFLLSSCQSKLEDESVFPKVRNVTELKNTDFATTLESSFDFKNNIVYGATVPFAWNEIRNKIGPVLTDFTSKQLEELNKTKSFINVLKGNEYETSIEVSGTEIKAKAYFRKSLPFEEPLIKFEKPLVFNNSNVESFGFWGNCEYAKLNYYNCSLP